MIDSKELLAVVDASDNPLTPRERSAPHQPGTWARSAHIWIVNNEGKILCHQRALTKDKNPGYWNRHFGGYGLAGEEYVDSALRELREEVGIAAKRSELKFYEKHMFEPHHTFQAVFIFRWNGNASKLRLEPDEVAQVAWLTPKEAGEPTRQWVDFGYEPGLLKVLENGN